MAQQYPILVLPEGALRTRGRDAQRNNIMAARQVADAVKTTLGPRGMDKMLVDSLGDITITNDGATIVDEMNVEHPAAKMMVEVAKTQDDEVGDGTTTAVVLTGELLKGAESLLDQNIHPSVIAKGFRMAAHKSHEILDEIGKEVGMKDEKLLKKIAETAMTGKSAEVAKEGLADLAVNAVRQVAEDENGKVRVDMDNIKVEKTKGGSISDSELIRGIIIDKERVHSGMPKKVKNAKIALVDAAIEVKKTETDAKIQINDPMQIQAFLDQEEHMIKEMVEKIAKSGANVLLCQKGIDDLAQHYLAKKGIFAIKSVKKSDMQKLAKATGARIVTSLDDLSKKDLGSAEEVEEEKISGDEMTFVRGCKDPKAVSVLVRGGTEHVVDEVERAMTDGLGGVASALEVGKIVTGGGAVEIELARRLRDYANEVGGREQLAINVFADAIEVIPRTLAESAGMDAIDTLVKLRAEHEKGNTDAGVDVLGAKVKDMGKDGVIEPLKIKTQAIKSASEAAEMLLRIDDIIAASKRETPRMPPGGGGMEDMY
ncbi:MAG: thermosome subunit [Candidatus Altiarchaeales archaeon WOR_SM1_86-2]|nr:MAG: thermosome subunit [Candidatus Altiarchaeales archaeon WOR_SM1_86-2]